jgi:hypothetical protein
MSGFKSKGHESVPVVVLNHNPKGRSDKPKVGKARGKTNLPQDTAGYGTHRTRP